MQKLFVYAGLALTAIAGIHASTLQQLSMDEMIQKSTIIVRGRAQFTYAAPRGSVIYTHYQVQIAETLKGTPATQLDVVVPGGFSNGLRQNFAGAPTLKSDQDYLLFLWTSKSGLTQVIGLSQGLFSVVSDASGQPIAKRAAATELMLNAAGQPVNDSSVQMPVADLRARIQKVLSGGTQ